MSEGKPRRIVVVGGVAGGAGAAAKARREDEHADIVVFERGDYVSFANCGLPYFIGETIPKRESLLLQTPESLWRRFRIRVKTRHDVLRIDPNARTVEVKDLASGQVFHEAYDALVLSPGASAIVPDLPGLPAPNVFTVKTVPDADAVKGWLAARPAKRAVVVGAGFIGLETAEALHQRGLDVTVVELLPQVLPPFDADAAELMAEHLRARGLKLVLHDGLKGFSGSPEVSGVLLESGRELPADLVILSIGVRPELKLAKEAGLAIGKSGGIQVDARQCTSDPSIFAAGDAVEVVQLVTGKPTRMPLAGPANKQAHLHRVAGANAAGGSSSFPGALGTAIVECMGWTAAKTGLSEREAAREGLKTQVTWTHNLDHAGYYPGAKLLHVKLITEEESGRLLGAQVLGPHGADKRIDVLATALAARMTVADLEELDLAYAPQFSSAKDPVIMAGFVAANAWRGEVGVITHDQLEALRASRGAVQVVDVRSAGEFAGGHLPGAVNIPVDDLRERLGELDPAREVVTYCRVGFRGYVAARILKQRGFERVRNLTGGVLSRPQAARAPA